jgi:hypothetical protein
MSSQQEIIERNVACTRAVLEFVQFIEEAIAEGGHDSKRFWVALAAIASDRAGLVEEEPAAPRRDSLEPMTDDEARRFGAKKIGFGQYQDRQIKDVPLSYLAWLSD